MNVNNKFELYLKREYQPAQDWYKKTFSREWIQRYIPSLNELLEKYYGNVQPGVYCIEFNGVPVYVGEAVKCSDRLLVHAHNLYRNPLEYFGVKEEEINDGKINIQVSILKENLYTKELRKDNELLCISRFKPLLQKCGTDICIPRANRRKVIETEILN